MEIGQKHDCITKSKKMYLSNYIALPSGSPNVHGYFQGHLRESGVLQLFDGKIQSVSGDVAEGPHSGD